MEKLLKSFIKMILEGDDVRVPTQLLSPDEGDPGNQDKDGGRYRDNRSRMRGKNGEEDEKNKVKEFCAAGGGAIAGMSGPITGPFTGVTSVKKRHKKKKAAK